MVFQLKYLPQMMLHIYRVSKREHSIVLGGSGYAKFDLEQWSQLNHGDIDDIQLTFKAYSDGVLVHMKSSLMVIINTYTIA